MEFVKKSLLALSMALSVATPLAANQYIPKIVTYVNEKTGKTIHVFHDIHKENYKEFIKSMGSDPENIIIRTLFNITEADKYTDSQMDDIMDAAKQLDASIIIEGPFIDEPKKRSAVAQELFNKMLLRKLHKQATDDGICINAEVRSCPDCLGETVIEKFFGHLDLATKQAYWQAYWQGKLPIMPHFSEELDLANEQTVKNYAAACENFLEKKLESFKDGKVAGQYYSEVKKRIKNNLYHKLMMSLSTEKKQSVEEKQQIDSLPNLKMQLVSMQHYAKLVQDLIGSTGSLELLDTNLVHEAVSSEKDTVFIVAGAWHCQNLDDPLTKLGYKKVKTTERSFLL